MVISYTLSITAHCSDTVAYCTSDSGLFLCPFTSKRSGLKVKATLKGHTGEVTQVGVAYHRHVVFKW